MKQTTLMRRSIVHCAEPSPSVSVPWLQSSMEPTRVEHLTGHHFKGRQKVDKGISD
jgi:hypothetical protein